MKRILLYSIILAVCASCKKFLDIEAPVNQITEAAVFNNDRTAMAAVNGLYAQVMSTNRSFLNGGITFYTGLSSDELVVSSPSVDFEPFQENKLASTHHLVWSQLWAPAYTHIYHINAALEGLEKGSVSPALKIQLVGELKFMRALNYFYLVNLFGYVPLVTSTDYRVNATVQRNSSEQICDHILADLEEAISLLPVAYPSAGRVRPNKATAQALTARVQLYLQNWKKAEEIATAIIGSGTYNLVSNTATVFLASSAETIWQLMPVISISNTAEGALFIPSSATVKPAYLLRPGLLNAFEAGDRRKTNWIASNTIAGTSYYYPAKYKVRVVSTPYTENNIVFRLAEQYLIRAEARAEQNKLPQALADLNTIRSRAGLAALNINNKDSLVAAIQKEKRVEFFTEFGHRWLDLKRWGKVDEVLGALKPTWSAHAKLYPVPQTELDRNPFLDQNPGY